MKLTVAVLALALWQGGLTQCEVTSPDTITCHGNFTVNGGSNGTVIRNVPSKPEPLDIPAKKRTRKVPAHLSTCEVGHACVVMMVPEMTEEYWYCDDPTRSLLVSQDGTRATCHWIAEAAK